MDRQTLRPSGTSRSMSRPRLTQPFIRRMPPVTVIVGAAGFGKSVLASQLSSVDPDVAVAWLDCGGQDPELGELPDVVARLLRGDAVEGDAILGSPLPPEASDALPVVAGRLREATLGRKTILVLDNVGLTYCFADVPLVLGALRQATGDESQLMVTSRFLGQTGGAARIDDIWFVDADDLRLSDDEGTQIAAWLGVESVTDSAVKTALGISERQVGLFSLLIQHPRSVAALSGGGSESRLPLGLLKSFEHLALSSLSPEQCEVLLCATLLGRGRVAEAGQVLECPEPAELFRAVSENMPLLRLSRDDLGSAVFEVHEMAVSAFARQGALGIEPVRFEHVRCRCYRELRRRGDLERLFALLIESGSSDLLADYLEQSGNDLLQMGYTRTLRAAMDMIPAETRLARPRLLLVRAALLRQTEQYDEAIHEARAALRLAETNDDISPLVQSSILLARLFIDTSDYEDLIHTLAPVRRLEQRLSPDDACLMHAYLAVATGQLGDLGSSKSHILTVRRMLAQTAVTATVRAHVANCCAFVTAYLLGDFNSASALVEEIPSLQGLPLLCHLQAKGNLGTLWGETGRTAASLRLLDETIRECSEIGANMLAINYESSRGVALAGLGDSAATEASMAAAIQAAEAFGDKTVVSHALLHRAIARRGFGAKDDALEDAESAVSGMRRLGLPSLTLLASMEVAACRCSLKDYSSATTQMRGLRQAAAELGSAYHLLRADMILAEIERERGEYGAAVDRITAQAEYVATESSNWQIAMYLRAFPGLLGVFAQAVGADKLPSHMLRMVLPEPARLGLDMARTILDPESFKTLAIRTLGLEEAEKYLAGDDRPARLKVGLFGGLSVVTPKGAIQDGDWRKRKSRLLFAMLVARRGEDVPKDLLFERLWPEMDEDRAKSNFYVIWSAMKRVLCNGPQADECLYVEHRAGVCRAVSDRILSDLDEFDAAAADLRAAERARNIQDAIEAGERLCMIYRGDVLPGDLYDDWFGPLRERYRDAFGDAMLQAAELAADGGQTEASLRFIRAGLAQDLWREDLYQAALRYQIASGQRSSAIETYFACRTKLADDLGLDPSVETQRLYEQVLAMEPAPSRAVRY